MLQNTKVSHFRFFAVSNKLPTWCFSISSLICGVTEVPSKPTMNIWPFHETLLANLIRLGRVLESDPPSLCIMATLAGHSVTLRA
jgi:hypothetical protein